MDEKAKLNIQKNQKNKISDEGSATNTESEASSPQSEASSSQSEASSSSKPSFISIKAKPADFLHRENPQGQEDDDYRIS